MVLMHVNVISVTQTSSLVRYVCLSTCLLLIKFVRDRSEFMTRGWRNWRGHNFLMDFFLQNTTHPRCYGNWLVFHLAGINCSTTPVLESNTTLHGRFEDSYYVGCNVGYVWNIQNDKIYHSHCNTTGHWTQIHHCQSKGIFSSPASPLPSSSPFPNTEWQGNTTGHWTKIHHCQSKIFTF